MLVNRKMRYEKGSDLSCCGCSWFLVAQLQTGGFMGWIFGTSKDKNAKKPAKVILPDDSTPPVGQCDSYRPIGMLINSYRLLQHHIVQILNIS